MSKRQLIEEIRQFNSTARPQFLAQFEEGALKQYLEHLTGARDKHIRNANLWKARGPQLRMVS